MAPAAAAGPGPGREREGSWASLVPAGLEGLRARAQAAAAEAEAGTGGLAVRGGLPRFAAKARAAAAGGGGRRPRVCYCGGSITAQRAGWRPALHGWLEHTFPCPGGVVDLPAFMGNVGSTVLSFLVEDWIVEGEPDLVILETAVNDGDYLLEVGAFVSSKRPAVAQRRERRD